MSEGTDTLKEEGLMFTFPGPRWEAVPSASLNVWHVRWSQPDLTGTFLYVAHYLNTHYGKNAAHRHANESNFHAVNPMHFQPPDS